MNMVVVAITVTLAGGAERAMPEPDYYAKALRWDDHRRQLEQNARLGWSVTWSASDVDAAGNRRITLRVTDRSGHPVAGIVAGIHLFHNADARRRLEATCEDAQPGVCHADLPAARDGLWTLHAEITRGADRFIDDREYEFPASTPAQR